MNVVEPATILSYGPWHCRQAVLAASALKVARVDESSVVDADCVGSIAAIGGSTGGANVGVGGSRVGMIAAVGGFGVGVNVVVGGGCVAVGGASAG